MQIIMAFAMDSAHLLVFKCVYVEHFVQDSFFIVSVDLKTIL